MTKSDKSRRIAVSDLIRAMRPNQWTKNVLVLAAFFFAFWDRTQPRDVVASLIVVPAALLFCLASSGVYLINDIRDAAADRAHPVKKFRPIAAGLVPVPLAGWTAALLLSASIAAGWLLHPLFGAVVLTYVAIQIGYTFGLKHVALVDIFVIAAGFVLRAIAGAVVIEVEISPWLLICTFLLALFLALCKRRHEKLFVSENSNEHRPSLSAYDSRLLDQLIAIASSATITAYAIYTLHPETVLKFGTHKLGFTLPFVVFGVFRYLDLAYRHEKGDRPEKILLSDWPILVNLALYALTVVLIFAWHG